MTDMAMGAFGVLFFEDLRALATYPVFPCRALLVEALIAVKPMPAALPLSISTAGSADATTEPVIMRTAGVGGTGRRRGRGCGVAAGGGPRLVRGRVGIGGIGRRRGCSSRHGISDLLRTEGAEPAHAADPLFLNGRSGVARQA
jgi:hypothetical protein